MRDPATIPRADWPTGARLHVGLVFPSPIPPRMVREFYEVVPEGVDLTTVTLSVTHLGDDAIREAGRGIEGACKQLAQYDVDLVYFLGVPPIVLQKPGFHRTLAERMAQASGLPSFTDLDGVLAGMQALAIRRVALATPFEPVINERIVRYLAAEGIEVTADECLAIRRNAEIRRLPIEAEYDLAAAAFGAAQPAADGIYTACGSWGSVHNVPKLERALGTRVVTWMNAFIGLCLRHGGIAARPGFGALLDRSAEHAGRERRSPLTRP